ncbi:helix-turn-helix transcriptional regulator [Vagococcus fessus]|uniref:Transcriptional regulator n=1 Tax=Vagococcus fessus TaxID=120370 RepID=A0A430ABJ5_9ENTE|nr:helix-turn-helix transcriptional regulator [Vagococcus fessus]RSU04582.1 transcriptional regulator [Vagococcus fessus]
MKNCLSEIRKQANLSQDALAKELRVSRQTISSLESGKYNPSIILAMRLARRFDLSVEDIFIYEEDEDDEFK